MKKQNQTARISFYERFVLVFFLAIFLLVYNFVYLLINETYVFSSETLYKNLSEKSKTSVIAIRQSSTLKNPDTNKMVDRSDNKNDFCLNVPVLLYHHIEPMDKAIKNGYSQLTVDSTVFEEQVEYLIDKGYRTISADELINALINSQSLSGRPVVITIDDGYNDNYEYAYQIAKNYRIVLNLMIPTGLIGTNGYLTWNNLKEMKNSGLIFLYNHTLSHFALPLGDAKTAETEILAAQIQLKKNLGINPRIFTYPYGSSNERDINILKRNGFLGAFSTQHSFTQCKEKIFNLKRNHIGNAPLSYYGL